MPARFQQQHKPFRTSWNRIGKNRRHTLYLFAFGSCRFYFNYTRLTTPICIQIKWRKKKKTISVGVAQYQWWSISRKWQINCICLWLPLDRSSMQHAAIKEQRSVWCLFFENWCIFQIDTSVTDQNCLPNFSLSASLWIHNQTTDGCVAVSATERMKNSMQ